MYRHFFLFVVALCAFTGSAWSQPTEAVPLKNWHAPLAWQATSADEMATAKEAPNARGESPAVTTPGSSTLLGVLVAITPCRLVDTRQNWPAPFGAGGSTPLVWAAGSTTVIPAPSGSCSLPAALAYSANITVIPSGAELRWLCAFPTGATMPTIATLTGYEGGIVSNAAVIPANAAGSFDVYVKDGTEVVIDVNGYYISPGALGLGTGTAAAPSLTFGDSSTGLYSTPTGGVSIAAFGVDKVDVNSTGLTVHGNASVTNLNFGGIITFDEQPTVVADSTDIFVGVGAPTSPGGWDTAFGNGALGGNSAGGTNNTAVGYQALLSAVSASSNTAVGFEALANAVGNQNTAVGSAAGVNVTSGTTNTAVGFDALYGNTVSHMTGAGNVAVGQAAGYNMSTGQLNVLVGVQAGNPLTTGSHNTLIGNAAGYDLGSGAQENIDIANEGASGDSGVIRIGDSNQNSTYIAGIRNVTTGGDDAVAVLIDSSGQLGTTSSSRRGKHDIEDMGDTTKTIMGLRPVRFRYNVHGNDGAPHYGLIAEEVAEVAPDLVARSKDGEIETVFYDKVNAMLLNQVQTQQREIDELRAQVAELHDRLK